MKDFLRRFDSIPDMLELDHLTVSGDVTMGKNVSLKVGYLYIVFYAPDGSIMIKKLQGFTHSTIKFLMSMQPK